MIQRFLILLGFAVSLFNGLPSYADTPASDQFTRLLNEAWEFNLREDPLFATNVGDTRYSDRLPSVSVVDDQRRLKAKRAHLERLEAIDRNALSRDEQINYDIFTQVLKKDIAEYEFEMNLIPITNRWGFHVDFPNLPNKLVFNSAKDYDDYVARLAAFDRYATQHIELMRAGIQKGLVLPAIVLEGYQDMIRPHIVDDPTKSLLYKPIGELPDRFSASDKARLSENAKRAIGNSVVPGYRKFFDFMQNEYVPSARGSIGASAMPKGRGYYRHRVRWFTTLDLTPEEVHNTGLSEVKRIRTEMDAVIKSTGFDGNFAAFVEFLRTDSRFYAESPQQLLKEVAFALKKMDGQLPRLFKSLPRTPYGIREIPDYIAPKTTTAYYMQPTGDGSRAGFYYVNTYNLKSRPLYEIEALSLHEAVPGHHLQIALQQELKELPEFRRFSDFTVFVEGWALYAERLGMEVGFYKDPYSDFGRLSYEMWRACRLVVDTGIHYLGWSRKRAIDFMAANTSLSIHNIEAEVDRYISWPGQALAYKIGELKIRQLRKNAEEELGKDFDIREFHDVVLGSGAVPLKVLEDNVQQFVESNRAATVSQ